MATIKVIGVGGGGGNAVQNMVATGVGGVSFICANTDAQALARASQECVKLQLGEKITKGLGAGANPEKGRDAAQESIAAIKEAVSGADLVFVTAGMGGGTGTGAAPVVAQAARDMDALTVAVVTKPFSFEGSKRARAAEQGIEELRQHVDSLIIIPNDRLRTMGAKKASLQEMMKIADEVLNHAVRGISDLITIPGYINVDFADVRTVMKQSGGLGMMGMGSATGESRAIEAARKAISSPLLEDVSISGAKGLLINFTASADLGMDEFGEANDYITAAATKAGDEPNIIIGTAYDDKIGDEVRITVIATGIEERAGTAAPVVSPRQPRAQQTPGKPVPPRGGQSVINFTGGSLATTPSAPQQAPATAGPAFRPVPGRSMPEEGSVIVPPTRHPNRPTQPRHTPGAHEFIFGPEEDIELPAFIRKQAN